MAIDIGFDEGGKGDILLVGVQMGVVQKARKFKTKWGATLDKYRVPYFHSHEFATKEAGIFAHLDKPQREELLSILAGHVRERLGAGLTFKTTTSFYNSHADSKFRSCWGASYTYLTQMLILGAHIYLKAKDLGKDINILIEDGHPNANQAYEHFQRMKKKGHPLINILTISMGSKDDHPILQAADMLVYSEWKKLCNADDLRIYNALHVPNSRYETNYYDCDKELVEISVAETKQVEAARKEWGQRRSLIQVANEQGISKIRQDDGAAAEGYSQRNQGKAGSGESSKKAKA